VVQKEEAAKTEEEPPFVHKFEFSTHFIDEISQTSSIYMDPVPFDLG